MSLSIIRRARPDDAAAIEDLYRQLVGPSQVAVLPERLDAVARDSRTALFVADIDGEVVATVLVFLCLDVMFRNQPFAVLENLIVRADRRGLGIGGALMREVERYCLAMECSKIMVLSSVERAEAHRFFERTGFEGAIKRGFVKYRRRFSSAE